MLRIKVVLITLYYETKKWENFIGFFDIENEPETPKSITDLILFRNTIVFQVMKFMSWLKNQKKRFSDTVIWQDIQ